jgi:hypothetical protein
MRESEGMNQETPGFWAHLITEKSLPCRAEHQRRNTASEISNMGLNLRDKEQCVDLQSHAQGRQSIQRLIKRVRSRSHWGIQPMRGHWSLLIHRQASLKTSTALQYTTRWYPVLAWNQQAKDHPSLLKSKEVQALIANNSPTSQPAN